MAAGGNGSRNGNGNIAHLLRLASKNAETAEKTLQIAGKTVEIAEKTLATGDRTLKITEKTLETAEKTLQTADKILKTAGRTLEVAEKTLVAVERLSNAADRILEVVGVTNQDLRLYVREAREDRHVLQNAVVALLGAEKVRQRRDERMVQLLSRSTGILAEIRRDTRIRGNGKPGPNGK